MVTIAIENAGGRKCLLLFPEDSRWKMVAAGTVSDSKIEVQTGEKIALISFPNSIIKAVAQEKKGIVLNDACHEGNYVNDDYIARNHTKSVICTPLVNQGVIEGILYLENNLATGVFTAERLEMLNLLLAQMAISIKNSRMVDNLESLVKTRTKTVSKQKDDIEVLLKELHHRVKNNLQTIASLLSLQSNRLEDDAARNAIRESEARVQSISLIHSKLYRSDKLSHVDMRDYLQSLCQNLSNSYDVSFDIIKLEVPKKQEIEVDFAIPLGLIVNELLTNFFKYAYPGNPHPLVTVEMKTTFDNQIQLTVSDNGPGIPSEKIKQRRPKSFGLKMINALCKQIEGRLDITNQKGTTVQLTFKT